MRLQAICPFEWKGGKVVQPGTMVEAIPGEDDELAKQWIAAGFLVDLDAAPPAEGEGPAEGEERPEGEARPAGEGNATAPMTSTDMPSHVGRRVRS
jgi:hypothetical protein